MSKGIINGAMAIVTFINFDDSKKYQIKLVES
jgi:hypothetical protein